MIFFSKNFFIPKILSIFAVDFTNVKRYKSTKFYSYKQKNLKIFTKMTEIYAPYGLRKKTNQVLGYSRPTINEALKGNSSTNIALRIRRYVLMNGGIELPEKVNG